MALVVGDITGHGIGAAADMALVRGMVSALLHSGVATSDVFSETVRCPQQRSGLIDKPPGTGSHATHASTCRRRSDAIGASALALCRRGYVAHHTGSRLRAMSRRTRG